MKVWLINQYAIPPTQAGITRHYSLAKALIRLGHDVTVIASSFDHVRQQETRLAGSEQCCLVDEAGVPFFWLKTPPYSGNSLSRVKNIATFTRSVGYKLRIDGLPRPDVIVGSSPSLPAAWGAQRLAARIGVPFVLEVRDLWPESLVALGKFSRKNPLVIGLSLVESFLYRHANSIVTLLPKSRDYIAAKRGRADGIFWVPNGVDLSLFPMSKPDDDGIFRVYYAGSHGLANALDSILDTAKILLQDSRCQNIKICLVGDGPHKKDLVARAHKEQIHNVDFIDSVPKETTPEVLQRADAFIVTLRKTDLYLYGTSLNKVYDYLASGRPVVFGAPIESNPVIEADAGIVVKPESSVEMAEAVKKLYLLGADRRISMGRRGRLFVEKNFSLDDLVMQFEKSLNFAVRGRQD